MQLHTRILLYTAFGVLMALFAVTIREESWDKSVGIGVFGALLYGLCMDWVYRRGARQADAAARRTTPPASTPTPDDRHGAG